MSLSVIDVAGYNLVGVDSAVVEDLFLCRLCLTAVAAAPITLLCHDSG